MSAFHSALSDFLQKHQVELAIAAAAGEEDLGEEHEIASREGEKAFGRLFAMPAATAGQAAAKLAALASYYEVPADLGIDPAAWGRLVAEISRFSVVNALAIADDQRHAEWVALHEAYHAAAAVETAYDAAHIHSIVPNALPIGPERNALCDSISHAVWEESKRLGDARRDIENQMLVRPSHNATAFAFKVLISRGDGRNENGMDDVLEAEARALLADAGVPA